MGQLGVSCPFQHRWTKSRIVLRRIHLCSIDNSLNRRGWTNFSKFQRAETEGGGDDLCDYAIMAILFVDLLGWLALATKLGVSWGQLRTDCNYIGEISRRLNQRLLIEFDLSTGSKWRYVKRVGRSRIGSSCVSRICTYQALQRTATAYKKLRRCGGPVDSQKRRDKYAPRVELA